MLLRKSNQKRLPLRLETVHFGLVAIFNHPEGPLIFAIKRWSYFEFSFGINTEL